MYLKDKQMEQLKHTRNFCIISHVDHGKSTLADRFLEVTHTIEKRKMREQVLDSMDLERERGITIKMQPVRMVWNPNHSEFSISNSQFSNLKTENSNIENSDSTYVLNLIDTPGHIDFSYEVSRALTAVEGAILLVDATQGVQAQTLTTLRMAREQGLVIIPAISKIDSPLAAVADTKLQLAKLLGVAEGSILLCSGRTGEGVEELLKAVIERVPPPTISPAGTQALIFDFQYSDHQGVIVFLRMFSGSAKKGDALEFAA